MIVWKDVIGQERSKTYFIELLQRIKQARHQGKIIYPNDENLFNAFKLTAFADIKVVILGQDPYHGPKQAHGLAFSVQKGVAVPPSLKNIYKELKNEYPEFSLPTHGNLENWAKQGVFLLNTVLSVEQGKAHSHARWGWEQFTDKVISQLSNYHEHLVFLLWGGHAQSKTSLIDSRKHLILKAPHPSPLSAYRGFFGCQHFIKTNHYLKQVGKTEVVWTDLV